MSSVSPSGVCSSEARSSSRIGSGAGGLGLGLWVEVGMTTAMAASWALGCLLGWTTAGLVVVRKLRVCCCWEGVRDDRVDEAAERRVVGGIVKNEYMWWAC